MRKTSDSSARRRLEFEKATNATIGTGKDTQAEITRKTKKLIGIGIENEVGLMQAKANVNALHRKVKEKKSESGIWDDGCDFDCPKENSPNKRCVTSNKAKEMPTVSIATSWPAQYPSGVPRKKLGYAPAMSVAPNRIGHLSQDLNILPQRLIDRQIV